MFRPNLSLVLQVKHVPLMQIQLFDIYLKVNHVVCYLFILFSYPLGLLVRAWT